MQFTVYTALYLFHICPSTKTDPLMRKLATTPDLSSSFLPTEYYTAPFKRAAADGLGFITPAVGQHQITVNNPFQ